MADAGFGKVESGEHRERRNRQQLKFGNRRMQTPADSHDSVVVYYADHRSDHLSSGRSFSSTARTTVGSDHDSITSHPSIHLAVPERCSGGIGPYADQEEGDAILSSPHRNSVGTSQEKGGEKGRRPNSDEYGSLYTRKQLIESEIRRHRSEVLGFNGRKLRRHRPASLDLNTNGTNVAILSPRFLAGGVVSMKKSSATSSHSRSEAFPSPSTPTYGHGTGRVAYQKGWSSERVPLQANYSQQYMGAGSYLPFNNGRVLPSKWEDAEKWIFSPVSTDGVARSSLPPAHHRRPKSKSGPLGPPGYSPASPIAPCFDSGRVGSFTGNSPFSAGVLVSDRGFVESKRGRIECGESTRSSSANADPYILRSASIHGCSDNLLESAPSLENSQDEKLECNKEGTKSSSKVVLRKDVAVQISPDGSTQSSPKYGLSFLTSPLAVNGVEDLESHFPKLEVRDVQVDDQVRVTRWTKKQIARGSDKRSTKIIEWKRKTVEAKLSGLKMSGTAKYLSKDKREEAKISAWENLQKAKAEAAIRKLEMKLEKRRSSSMDKILKKLRSAQKKAEEMRTAVTAIQTHQEKVSYCRRTGQISSLSGCFICHAF